MRLKYLMYFLLFLVSCDQKIEPNSKPIFSKSPFKREAEVVSVICRISNVPADGLKLLVEGYYWDTFRPIASYSLQGQEIFHQFTEDYSLGLYRLSVTDIQNSKPIYFIVNGRDKKIQVDAEYESFIQGAAKVSPSDETFCLAEVIQLHARKTFLEDSLKAALRNVTVINPRYYSLKDVGRKEMELNKLAFYNALDVLSNSFPETYVNNVVVKLLRKQSRYEADSLLQNYETEPAMLNRHYFEGVDISDHAYLGHPIFYQSLNEYLIENAGEKPDEFVMSANKLLQHISNQEIKKTVVDFLVFYFLDRSQDQVAEDIAFANIEGCNDDYIAQIRASDRYRSGPQVKGPLPSLLMPNISGELMDVNQIVKGGKITLLYFWKSSCQHCNDEHPVIKRLHELYSDQGLRIVGVCLDSERKSWEGSVNTLGLNWINLCDFKGISSSSIYDYAIKSTPTTFVVSQNGTVMAKDLKGGELNRFFKSYFNPDNLPK